MALLLLLLAGIALGLAFWALARQWPEHVSSWPALVVPLLALVVCFAAPGAAEAPAHHLAALRADPYQLWDARAVGLADLVTWALARLLGDSAAVLFATALFRALALVLVYALCRVAGFGAGTALGAQAMLLLMPEPAAAVALGSVSSLLAQVLVLLLLVHLGRRLPHLDGARDAGAAFLFLALAAATGPDPWRDVAALVGVVSVAALAAGEGRRARRLLAAAALALTAVGLLLYGGALPALWREGVDFRPGAVATALAAGHGLLPFLLLLPGWRALGTTRPEGALALRAALLAGALRALLGATDTALLSGPLAVLAAAGFARLWRWDHAGASAVQPAT